VSNEDEFYFSAYLRILSAENMEENGMQQSFTQEERDFISSQQQTSQRKVEKQFTIAPLIKILSEDSLFLPHPARNGCFMQS